jgi:hypothetical protein
MLSKINSVTQIVSVFIILSLFSCISIAKEQSPEVKEIIGSGIFSVNETREFTITNDSIIYLDGVEIDYGLFEIIGSGFKSAFTLKDDVNSSVDSGSINAIELVTNIQGPVTSVAPLEVLEQPVLLTADTVLSVAVPTLVNQDIAISGYLNNNNSLKATKVLAIDNPQNWKIRGFISDLSGQDFQIGQLLILRNNMQLIDCNNDLANGMRVELLMARDDNYQKGSAVTTLGSVRCLLNNQIADESEILPTVIQGFISQTRGHDFWFDDIKVSTSNATVFENGEKQFIDDAVNVEVQGLFDAQSSTLQASSVRFLDTRIEISFPLVPQDVVINKSISLHGMIFKKTPQSKDNSQILANGINTAIQVQVNGYVDSNGNAYISKLVNKGSVDLNRISIRGQVSAINKPFFTLLSFDFDSANSLIKGPGLGVIDSATFFNLLEVGSQLEIKNAHYNAVTDQLSDGIITIKKIHNNRNFDTPETKEIIGSGIFSGFGIATITATSDQLYISSFE